MTSIYESRLFRRYQKSSWSWVYFHKPLLKIFHISNLFSLNEWLLTLFFSPPLFPIKRLIWSTELNSNESNKAYTAYLTFLLILTLLKNVLHTNFQFGSRVQSKSIKLLTKPRLARGFKRWNSITKHKWVPTKTKWGAGGFKQTCQFIVFSLELWMCIYGSIERHGGTRNQ